MKQKKVGVFGGSFNPIHNGHIGIADDLLKNDGENHLDEIWFVVSPHNPLKSKSGLLPDDLRYSLVEKALEGRSAMRSCDVEFHIPQPSYMWTTLQELQRQHPEVQFMLLMGADNWLCFDHWYHYEDILRTFEIGIYPRPNYAIDPHSLPDNVHYLQTGLYDISGTEIRERLQKGESVAGLVPDILLDSLTSAIPLMS